jgi:microcystin-dependent protein
MKQKPKKNRGSALLLTTILMFVILSMVVSLTYVTVMEQKMSQKTKSSVGAFYGAESGVEWALNQIATAPNPDATIQSRFSLPLGDNKKACPFGGCDVYLLDKDGKVITQILANILKISDIKAVRSVGAQGGETQRAIEAAVASTGATPVGAILPYAGSIAPAGFLLCDGASYLRSTYPGLATLIGGGGVNFSVPDLRGKAIVGYSSTESEFNALYKTGGEKGHVLTTPEMPAHGHSSQSSGDGGGVTQGGGSWNGPWATVPSGSSTGQTGSGTSHNNLQPYITLNYIISYQ